MTFFDPKIPFIPNREDSVKALLNFVRSFLVENSNSSYFKHYIFLKTSARIGIITNLATTRVPFYISSIYLGYEYVFQEIHKSTGLKIHANEQLYTTYKEIPNIQSILTRDARSTPIHACLNQANIKKHNPTVPTCEIVESLSSSSFF